MTCPAADRSRNDTVEHFTIGRTGKKQTQTSDIIRVLLSVGESNSYGVKRRRPGTVLAGLLFLLPDGLAFVDRPNWIAIARCRGCGHDPTDFVHYVSVLLGDVLRLGDVLAQIV